MSLFARVLSKVFRDPSIIRVGNPILIKPSLPVSVDDIKSSGFIFMVNQLKRLTRANNAFGISAVQIGVPLQCFVLDFYNINLYARDKSESLNKISNDTYLEVFINPRIIHMCREKKIGLEGCLSFDNIHAKVQRSTSITIEYMDMNGELIKREYTHMAARTIQHEMDHLHGELFVDKMEPKTFTINHGQ